MTRDEVHEVTLSLLDMESQLAQWMNDCGNADDCSMNHLRRLKLSMTKKLMRFAWEMLIEVLISLRNEENKG
jgi:hypothetical protein